MTTLTLHESLRNLAREANDVATNALREHNLTYNQYLTLACIGDYTPICAADIGRYIAANPASIAHATSTLRGRGYITRGPATPGSIALPLYITQDGLTALTAATKTMRGVDREISRHFTDTTIQGIADAYVALRDWYDLPI